MTEDFTRVYGDSFISGFIEGGEFNALISVKLNNKSDKRKIEGELQVNLDLKKVAQVSGSASVEKVDDSSTINGETSIAVSWTGGGDIKDAATGNEWTLEKLKAVAMEFPRHVMACPICTKYVSLSLTRFL